MDKGNYETYEYLPANASENDQFFVVQDNGTFVISRNPAQYAAQVQSKEALETVHVFNVTQQQFLVDVDNSSELISVSDQFIIPEAEQNLYANSYLLQPGTSAPTEPMKQESNQDVAAELKQVDSQMSLDIADETSKQTSSCTEITLTDEQYQMLEQKGWILLEISDKIYVLDTLGLHDITANQKLIQKLKNEGESNDNQTMVHDSRKLENLDFENTTTESVALQDTQCIIENNIIIDEAASIEPPSYTPSNKEDNPVSSGIKSITPIKNSSMKNETNSEEFEKPEAANQTNTRVLVIENEDIRRVGNTLKVKTKLSLKDFPDKIVLGKMANGKNLIAKVVKPVSNNNNESLNNDHYRPDENSQSVTDDLPAHLNNSNILNEPEFYLLMQYFFQNNITKCNAEDLVTADYIISQLLEIPSFKSPVIDNKLVITKTIQSEDSSGKTTNKGLCALVTGKVSLIVDQWRFVHLPHMLQDITTNTEQYRSKYNKDKGINKPDLDVLHVQILEAKHAVTDVTRVSVTVNKRSIPLHIIGNKPKAQPSTMYACSICAAIFNTESDLKEHQTNNCVKSENMLTIDMDEMIKPRDYCIINNGKTKTYACMQCNAKFSRLTTCKNHLKTHCAPKTEDENEKSHTKGNSNYGIYKCNMCSSTYFHPSTLSKHILARHIKIKK